MISIKVDSNQHVVNKELSPFRVSGHAPVERSEGGALLDLGGEEVRGHRFLKV